jgi:fluoroquinolone transport system permease protein
MKRLVATTRLDMAVQARSKLYAVAIGLAVLLGFGMRFLLPRDLMPTLLPLFYLFSVGGTAYLFVAGMVIFERGEHTLDAQIVSPLRVNEYLVAKTLSLLIVVLLESFLVLGIAYGFRDLNLLLFFGGVTLMSVGLTLGGFVQVCRYKSVTDFLLPAATVLIVLQLPWLGLSGIVSSPVWYLVPTMAPTLLLVAALRPIAAWEMVYALLYSLLTIGILFWWARRAFYNHLILKGGA